MRRSLWMGLFVLTLLGVVAQTPPVHAATTINVNTTADELDNNGNCSLREALAAANTDSAVDACPAGSADDVISLPQGKYSLSIGGTGEDAGLKGDLDIMGDVALVGAGSDLTEITGGALDRVLDVQAGVHVTLKQLAIRFGQPEPGADGGGIRNFGQLDIQFSAITSNAVLPSCTYHSCNDANGAGIANGGTLTIAHSVINDNTGNIGGGLYNLNNSEATVTGSLFSGNVTHVVSRDPDSGDGAGIENAGQLHIIESTLTNNTADGDGGGMTNDVDGSTTIETSTVRNNQAGGGAGITNLGTMSIAASTIHGNLSPSDFGWGGGIGNYGALTLRNSTISSNTAAGRGGGLFNGIYSCCLGIATDTLLNNVTLADNTSNTDNSGPGDGGGIAIDSGTTVEISNSIIAKNSDGVAQSPDCSGGLTSQGYNLIQNTTGCAVSGDTTGNIIGKDPLLGPLDNHGGATFTRPLFASSSALDRANPAAPGSGENACEATDQRAITRPQDGDGDGSARCDMGAFEKEGTGIARVDVDIKPGSDTNPINLKSKGNIPVAILSTDAFDATTIDPSSVQFGPNGAHALKSTAQDVNGDGRSDLLLHFRTQETGMTANDTQACLTGSTRASMPVQGCDAIRLVP